MQKGISWVAVVVGIVLILVALLAAQLGLGGASFGLKHIVVLVVGIILLIGGLFTALRPAGVAS